MTQNAQTKTPHLVVHPPETAPVAAVAPLRVLTPIPLARITPQREKITQALKDFAHKSWKILRPRLMWLAQTTWQLTKTIALSLWQKASDPEMWLSIRTHLRETAQYAHGWVLWYWRKLRLDSEFRLGVLCLTAGFFLTFAVIIASTHLFQSNAMDTLETDPSVPAPQLAMIEAIPGEDMEEDSSDVTASAQSQTPAQITPANFHFEQFEQVMPNGQVHFLSHTAAQHLRTWYPVGTPATQVMRFVGDVLMRADGTSGDTAAASSRRHCMRLPINKVFTDPTITCTYGHALKAANPRLRAFWILSLTHDSAGRMTHLEIHARSVLAPKT